MLATSRSSQIIAFASLRCTNCFNVVLQPNQTMHRSSCRGWHPALSLDAALQAPDVGGACPAGGGRARRVVWSRHPARRNSYAHPLHAALTQARTKAPEHHAGAGLAVGGPGGAAAPRRCARRCCVGDRQCPGALVATGLSSAALVAAAASTAQLAANLPSV